MHYGPGYSAREIAEALALELGIGLEESGVINVRNTPEEMLAEAGIQAVEPGLPGEEHFYVTTTTYQRFIVSVRKV